jgi:hypothetical protein
LYTVAQSSLYKAHTLPTAETKLPYTCVLS